MLRIKQASESKSVIMLSLYQDIKMYLSKNIDPVS